MSFKKFKHTQLGENLLPVYLHYLLLYKLQPFCFVMRKVKIFDFLNNQWIMLLCIGSHSKGFALYHDKSLHIYFFYVQRQANNDFLKDVECSVNQKIKECMILLQIYVGSSK